MTNYPDRCEIARLTGCHAVADEPGRYSMKLHGPHGFATITRCRFDDPERAMARAMDALGTMGAFVEARQEMADEIIR